MPYTMSNNPRKVIFSHEEVAAYVTANPECGLQATRSYWFEFDANADLIDTDTPEQDHGTGATALTDEARSWLEDSDGRAPVADTHIQPDAHHTPGPWHTGGDGTIIYAADGWGVASATVSHARHAGRAGALVNARLIAAAPELLQALRDCIEQMEQCERMFRDDVEFMAALNRAREAQP